MDMYESHDAIDVSDNMLQKVNATLAKINQYSGNNNEVESILLFPELLRLIKENNVQEFVVPQLLDIFQNWNFTDNIKEMDVVIKLLVFLKNSSLNHCYIKKITKYIERYDLSELVLTKQAQLSEFLLDIININKLDNPGYFYDYAMHLQIKINDLNYTRLNTLLNHVGKFVQTDDLFHHGIKDDYSNTNIHHNNSGTVERQLLAISKNLEKQLFVTAASFISEQQDVKFLDSKYVSFLITVASSDLSYLSWSAITVLFKFGITQNRTDLLELIFPTLISKVVEPFESNKVLEKYTRTHHIPLDLLPISMLADCVNKYPVLTKHLNDIKMVQKIDEWYSNFSLSKGYISRFDSVCFAKYLIIMSNMVSIDDKTKWAITKSKINQLMVVVLEKHVEILKLWTFRNHETMYRKAFMLSIEIVTAACILLRCLSRSASFLRTFFIKNNYINLLSHILFIDSEQLCDISMGEYFLDKEMALETIVLGTLSNLVIEFLPSSEDFNVHEIVKVAYKYLQDDSLRTDRCLAALSFIRNGLFANDVSFFQEFEKIIGVYKIFSLCDHENVNIQIQSFNIIRNMLTTKTANSNPNYVYEMFTQYSDDGTIDFVEFVRIHLNQSRNLILTTTLCYTLVHFSSLNVENKITMIKNNELMKNLLDILQMKQKTRDIQESFWEVKTCIAWIIINLTTADSDGENVSSSRIRTLEDQKLLQTSERSNILIEMGFHETFKMLPHDCPSVDFIERASRAVFQLLVSCNNN